MAIALGNAPVTNLKVGDTQATRAYLGTVIVWQYGAAQTWTGTPATITVTAASGTWAQPQVWTRTTTYVVLEDGDTVVWYDEPVVDGIEASIIVVGTSGTWVAAQHQTWTATPGTVTVVGASGTWAEAQVWTRTAATVTVTAASGTWSLGLPAQTWTATAATVTVTALSGTWSVAAAGGAWSLDFTDDALGISAGWTSYDAFRLGVANFSGTKKACTVDPGDGSYVDWYYTRSGYNTALCTSVNQTIRAEVEFGVAGSEIFLWYRANATQSSRQGIKIVGNGTWQGEYDGGGDGGSGTFTSPGLNTLFTFEVVVGPGNAFVAKVNTTTIVSGTHSNTRTGLYGGVSLSGQAKMLRYYHGNT